MLDTSEDRIRETVQSIRNQTDRAAFEKLQTFLNSYSKYTDSLYWYPLVSLKREIPVAAYDLDKIYDDRKIYLLEEILRVCNIRAANAFQMQISALKLHQVNMIDQLYEKDSDGYNFPWKAETYYFDDTEAWLIYISHEGTITFTGERLVKTARCILDPKYLYH